MTLSTGMDPPADMKPFRMATISTIWLTDIYIFHMAPTAMTMVWFKSVKL